MIILRKFYSMGRFDDIANKMVLYKLKTTWLKSVKLYNDLPSSKDCSLSMSFVLLAINNEKGSTVTSIAPRLGMEPNSLSRLLKKLLEDGFIYKQKSENDKRIVYICLTELGIEKQAVALKSVNALENSIKSSISKEDLKGFFAVSNAIETAVDDFE